MNPRHDVEFGAQAPELVECIIEIPKGSHNKYEVDKKSGPLRVDRVLFSAVHFERFMGRLDAQNLVAESVKLYKQYFKRGGVRKRASVPKRRK